MPRTPKDGCSDDEMRLRSVACDASRVAKHDCKIANRELLEFFAQDSAQSAPAIQTICSIKCELHLAIQAHGIYFGFRPGAST